MAVWAVDGERGRGRETGRGREGCGQVMQAACKWCRLRVRIQHPSVGTHPKLPLHSLCNWWVYQECITHKTIAYMVTQEMPPCGQGSRGALYEQHLKAIMAVPISVPAIILGTPENRQMLIKETCKLLAQSSFFVQAWAQTSSMLQYSTPAVLALVPSVNGRSIVTKEPPRGCGQF
jgi:hypothetical protein